MLAVLILCVQWCYSQYTRASEGFSTFNLSMLVILTLDLHGGVYKNGVVFHVVRHPLDQDELINVTWLPQCTLHKSV